MLRKNLCQNIINQQSQLESPSLFPLSLLDVPVTLSVAILMTLQDYLQSNIYRWCVLSLAPTFLPALLLFLLLHLRFLLQNQGLLLLLLLRLIVLLSHFLRLLLHALSVDFIYWLPLLVLTSLICFLFDFLLFKQFSFKFLIDSLLDFLYCLKIVWFVRARDRSCRHRSFVLNIAVIDWCLVIEVVVESVVEVGWTLNYWSPWSLFQFLRLILWLTSSCILHFVLK